ncbi:hypothetical protein [Acinetobacter seifertii]|uniref:hypothetical protein n=1 Tax=Acinetobacter seifertii TaxID=1530123 RepID=UPI0012501857|nr:hypothetical protein [Acinetobacter seifertii]
MLIFVAVTSAVIAILSLLVSAITLWRSHFALLKPISIAGRLQHRIYPIKSDNSQWFLSSFDIPVSLCNSGAQPLLIQDMRLKLHYCDIPILKNHEFIQAKWEIDQGSVSKIDKNRFQWIDDICPIDWMPFSILPKVTVTKHLIFESRWDKPVIQNEIQVELQALTTGSDNWVVLGMWNIHLDSMIWSELVNVGTSISYKEKKGVVQHPKTYPEDLHKYLGSKDPIPNKGFDSSPSYLNFPSDTDS